jgi:hypothetical protein
VNHERGLRQTGDIDGKVCFFVPSVFCGIRHLIWDAGWMMECPRCMTGWIAIDQLLQVRHLVIGELMSMQILWPRVRGLGSSGGGSLVFVAIAFERVNCCG